MRIKFSDLAKMSEEEKTEVLNQLIAAAKQPVTQEQIDNLKNRIQEYEKSHNMTTQELKDKLSNGLISETWEHCQWLIWSHELDRILKLRKNGPVI